MKKLSSGTFLVVATVLVGLMLGVFGILKLRSWNRPAPSFAKLTLTKLSNSTNIVTAAISPGGQAFVYVSTDGSKQSLLIQQIDSQSVATEIVGPTESVYHGLTFSPDGNIVFFVRSSGSDSPAVYRVSARGGPPTLLYKDVNGPVTVSADGRSLAYVRAYPDQKQTAVVVGQVDGSNERVAAVLKDPEDAFLIDSGPAFSPNGKLVAVAARHSSANGDYQNVLAVNVNNGTVRSVGESRFHYVGRIGWHAVGGSLVLTAAQEGSTAAQVWQLSYPAGELTRVTNDANDYQNPTLSRDSRQILTVQTQRLGEKQGNLVLLRGSE